MNGENYRIYVEVLENGFSVEVPDAKARAKKMAEAKKANHGGSGGAPMPYLGDCTKKYAAKSVKEVVALVTEALEGLPENEYDAAFEAAGKST